MKVRLILVSVVALAGVGLLWLLFWQTPGPSTSAPLAVPQIAPPTAASQNQPTPAPSPPFESAPPVTPQIPAEAALQGSVVTEEGFPVQGALVSAYQPDLGAARVVADDAGDFVFLGLPEGAFRVSARATGYNEAVLEAVQQGSLELSLVMSPLSIVAGRVVEADSGLPIPEFDVLYLDFVPGDGVYWREMARTDASEWQSVSNLAGDFALDGVASGKPVAIGARARGFAPAYAELDPIAPGETSPPVTLALDPAAGVEGRVVDASKRPIEGVAIHLGSDKRKPVQEITDAQGRFSLSDLTPSVVVLTASHPNFIDQTFEVSLATPPVVVEVVLDQGGRIEGTVLLENEPLPGALVVAGNLGRDGFHKRTDTDASGHFSLAGIPLGEAEVFVDRQGEDEAEEGRRQLQRRVLVEEGRVTHVDFRFPEMASTLEGVISLHGRAPASATLRGTIAGEGGDAFFSAAVGDDGAYRASELAPGEAWIQVGATTASGAERRHNFALTIPEGAVIRHDISLEGTGVLMGTVGGLEDGDAGEVMVLPADNRVDMSDMQALLDLQSIQSARAKIQSDGRFHLEGLDSGSYTLLALVFRPGVEDGADLMSSVLFASAPVAVHTGETARVNLSLTR